MKKDLAYFWKLKKFKPNAQQEEAILYTDGPLFLTAGPGSGKTRVLLWRTLNLIVFHGVSPGEIYLSTFTEKAALQLKEGLRSLLGMVSNETGKPYDLSKMAIGTVHSICQTLITDRRFSPGGARKHAPILMDELSQYFMIYNRFFWQKLWESAGFKDEDSANKAINEYFSGFESQSRHNATTKIIDIFNRFSEESLNPDEVITGDAVLSCILKMYRTYLDELNSHPLIKQVDFSLLQKMAFENISAFSGSSKVFKHVIIDEYQDTNAIQEKIFFELAKGHKNICVVGDDDQALYRFRGATVENLVEFEERCENYLGLRPKRIDLSINYRSRKKIVDAYTDFINLIDWEKAPPQKGYHRVYDKKIRANSEDEQPSVIVSTHAKGELVYKEIAEFVLNLKISKIIEDYKQCAFLFPAMKGATRVEGFMNAFDQVNKERDLIGTEDELKVYAPRAGRFLNVEEARAIWGLIMLIFGRPHYGPDDHISAELRNFRFWQFNILGYANELCKHDPLLREYVEDRQGDLATIRKDYEILVKVVSKNKLNVKDPFRSSMVRIFAEAPGLSLKGKRNLTNKFFRDIIDKREREGNPFTIEYIINRSTSLDWSILDLFYQLNGFKHFREMFALAQCGQDEGPICNLGLITQYLSRFMEEYSPVITAAWMQDDKFQHSFFSSYSYALWRRGESEYEDADDPFPKGRISFLTIHQAKGLEFPVVVLGSVFKNEFGPDQKESIVRDLLDKGGEPLDRISKFDNMRMFYVALSRAENLLVLPRYTHAKNASDEFKQLFENNTFTEIPNLAINTVPKAEMKTEDLGKTYSYTADYLNYDRCPRQYMIMRMYGFVPSRSQTMFFGSLVHQTIDDLHNYLIEKRKNAKAK